MRWATVLFWLVVALGGLDARPNVPRSDDAAIAHALNRLTFGPRPEDAAAVRKLGLERWIEAQLTPGATARPTAPPPPLAQRPAPGEVRQIILEAGRAKLHRALTSERQLEEVLVDFWFNHFNVFARKGPTALFLRAYEEQAIRPHVLGRFRDLLGATAESPAMLIYLDNWQSNRRRGINENYARELLELHTLGVDGGYTQQDIVDVARAFTGWTVARQGSPGFRFAPSLHDRDAKTILGHALKAGGGVDDGKRVLDVVAQHPSTARHVSFKLVQRFVSDVPPPHLVERAAQTFQRTNGNLRDVVRVIVTSPEFFDPAVRLGKVKTPFEFVVSALRATDAEIQNPTALLRTLADMGMPPYLCQPPTGYADTADAWVSSGALVQRINFAVALSGGEVRGVRVGTARTDALALGSASFQRQ
jgi:uncharacterized protein (DUF1800 family)